MDGPARWDTGDYLRIRAASYDPQHQQVKVQFFDGDIVAVPTKHLTDHRDRDIEWQCLDVEDSMHVHVPTGGDPVEIPGFAIRSLTDAAFAAHLARRAEESARRVGERLRALRKARGLTAKEVAERAGVAPLTITRIELGQHDVVFTTLEKILAAMGCTLRELVEPLWEPMRNDVR